MLTPQFFFMLKSSSRAVLVNWPKGGEVMTTLKKLGVRLRQAREGPVQDRIGWSPF